MNKKLEWVVENEYKGKRLDASVNKKFDYISRSEAQTLIKENGITVDGCSVKPSIKLKGNEVITIFLKDKEEIKCIEATPLNFPVVFEDDHIIVINKPSGLVVHPGAGHEKTTVVSALLSHTKLSPIGAPIRPGVVQRLDKATSGLMVLAKTEASHRKMAELFSTHDIEKEYTAIIQGHIVNRKGRIEVAIERDRVHRKRMQPTTSEKGRMAISQFEVIEYLNGATLVRVNIKTGRTHQIRVHMAFAGHPLLGDTLYRGRKLNGKAEHFLHSTILGFSHPITNEKMRWQVDLPDRFSEVLNELKN